MPFFDFLAQKEAKQATFLLVTRQHRASNLLRAKLEPVTTKLPTCCQPGTNPNNLHIKRINPIKRDTNCAYLFHYRKVPTVESLFEKKKVSAYTGNLRQKAKAERKNAVIVPQPANKKIYSHYYKKQTLEPDFHITFLLSDALLLFSQRKTFATSVVLCNFAGNFKKTNHRNKNDHGLD